MKPLIAVTCLAVLAATGWYGYSEWRRFNPSAPAWYSDPQNASFWEDGDREYQLRKCERTVSDWDGGNRAVIEANYGTFAEDVVNSCRNILSMMRD